MGYPGDDEMERARENRAPPSKSGRPKCVLQEWVMALTLMQQSVLLAAIRGPDGIAKDHPVKVLLRWYRRCILLSAFEARVFADPYEDDGGSFTGPCPVAGTIHGYCGEYLRHIDELPHHFHLHFQHAAEIVGYKHPNEEIREFWGMFYHMVVKDAHLNEETEEQMDSRLGDNRNQWLSAEVVIARNPLVEADANSEE